MNEREFWDVDDYASATAKIVGHDKDWNASTAGDIGMIFDSIPGADGVAVEIGCGAGRLMLPLMERFDSVIGLDVAPRMIDHARAYLGPLGDVRLIGDAFPVGDASADVVFSFTVFQHIHDLSTIRHYLKETARILAPGGIARIQTRVGTPTRGKFRGYHGHGFGSPAEFAEEFAEAGLTVSSVVAGLGHPEWIWVTACRS